MGNSQEILSFHLKTFGILRTHVGLRQGDGQCTTILVGHAAHYLSILVKQFHVGDLAFLALVNRIYLKDCRKLGKTKRHCYRHR